MSKFINYNRPQLFALVTLRVLIGWYFLYEGLSKLLVSGWTSFAYLNDSAGIFKPFFLWIAENSTLMHWVDIINIYGLILVGLSFILGAYVKLSSYGAIVLLSLYYLSHPPLIETSYLLRAEGSALWVDKNLVMLGAIVVLMLFPNSKRIGLDRFLLKK
jgi:thiosulfate dehydrogenase [quinone] large subunit